MCTRPYPECTVFSEGYGADGDCDTDNITQNANNSEALDTSLQDRSVITISRSGYKFFDTCELYNENLIIVCYFVIIELFGGWSL